MKRKFMINVLSIIFLVVMIITANMADTMEPAWKWFWCGFDTVGLILVLLYHFCNKDGLYYEV